MSLRGGKLPARHRVPGLPETACPVRKQKPRARARRTWGGSTSETERDPCPTAPCLQCGREGGTGSQRRGRWRRAGRGAPAGTRGPRTGPGRPFLDVATSASAAWGSVNGAAESHTPPAPADGADVCAAQHFIGRGFQQRASFEEAGAPGAEKPHLLACLPLPHGTEDAGAGGRRWPQRGGRGPGETKGRGPGERRRCEAQGGLCRLEPGHLAETPPGPHGGASWDRVRVVARSPRRQPSLPRL